jgi:plastocyanin
VYIKEGQTIIWTNNDNNIHTVTQRDYSNSGSNYEDTIPTGFNSGVLNRGQSFAQLFYKEGKYGYYCTIHPWMIGQAIVYI